MNFNKIPAKFAFAAVKRRDMSSKEREREWGDGRGERDANADFANVCTRATVAEANETVFTEFANFPTNRAQLSRYL